MDDSVHNPVGILGTQYLGVVSFAACMSCDAKITGLLLRKTSQKTDFTGRIQYYRIWPQALTLAEPLISLLSLTQGLVLGPSPTKEVIMDGKGVIDCVKGI